MAEKCDYEAIRYDMKETLVKKMGAISPKTAVTASKFCACFKQHHSGEIVKYVKHLFFPTKDALYDKYKKILNEFFDYDEDVYQRPIYVKASAVKRTRRRVAAAPEVAPAPAPAGDYIATQDIIAIVERWPHLSIATQDIIAIVERWPHLSESVKSAIMLLIRPVDGNES